MVNALCNVESLTIVGSVFSSIFRLVSNERSGNLVSAKFSFESGAVRLEGFQLLGLAFEQANESEPGIMAHLCNEIIVSPYFFDRQNFNITIDELSRS